MQKCTATFGCAWCLATNREREDYDPSSEFTPEPRYREDFEKDDLRRELYGEVLTASQKKDCHSIVATPPMLHDLAETAVLNLHVCMGLTCRADQHMENKLLFKENAEKAMEVETEILDAEDRLQILETRSVKLEKLAAMHTEEQEQQTALQELVEENRQTIVELKNDIEDKKNKRLLWLDEHKLYRGTRNKPPL